MSTTTDSAIVADPIVSPTTEAHHIAAAERVRVALTQAAAEYRFAHARDYLAYGSKNEIRVRITRALRDADASGT